MQKRETDAVNRKKQFLSRAKAVHGRRFSYTHVEYINSRTPVTIVCSRHPEPVIFRQTPHDHLKGNGCPHCSGRRNSTSASRGLTFVLRARDIHGGRYDYDAASYVDAHSAVTVVCREHGPFRQRATKHLGGRGCPTCGTRRPSQASD